MNAFMDCLNIQHWAGGVICFYPLLDGQCFEARHVHVQVDTGERR
jgi:hypothetical protein